MSRAPCITFMAQWCSHPNLEDGRKRTQEVVIRGVREPENVGSGRVGMTIFLGIGMRSRGFRDSRECRDYPKVAGFVSLGVTDVCSYFGKSTMFLHFSLRCVECMMSYSFNSRLETAIGSLEFSGIPTLSRISNILRKTGHFRVLAHI